MLFIFEKTKNVSFEVIVVDNNSKDGSVEAIIDEFPRVRVFPLKENIGFGKACEREVCLFSEFRYFFIK